MRAGVRVPRPVPLSRSAFERRPEAFANVRYRSTGEGSVGRRQRDRHRASGRLERC
jgi:hypothetical protein